MIVSEIVSCGTFVAETWKVHPTLDCVLSLSLSLLLLLLLLLPLIFGRIRFLPAPPSSLSTAPGVQAPRAPSVLLHTCWPRSLGPFWRPQHNWSVTEGATGGRGQRLSRHGGKLQSRNLPTDPGQSTTAILILAAIQVSYTLLEFWSEMCPIRLIIIAVTYWVFHDVIVFFT